MLKKNLFGAKLSLLGSTVQIQIIQINIYLKYENICDQTWQYSCVLNGVGADCCERSDIEIKSTKSEVISLLKKKKVVGMIETILV